MPFRISLRLFPNPSARPRPWIPQPCCDPTSGPASAEVSLSSLGTYASSYSPTPTITPRHSYLGQTWLVPSWPLTLPPVPNLITRSGFLKGHYTIPGWATGHRPALSLWVAVSVTSPCSTALGLAPQPFLHLSFTPCSQWAENRWHRAGPPGLACYHHHPTSAGQRVLQNAGSWGEAWLVPRPLLGWPGPEAGAQSWRRGGRCICPGQLKEPGEDPLSWSGARGPRLPREDGLSKETETTRRLCKQALSSLGPGGRRPGVSVCTLDTARHSPLSVGQIHCIEKLVPLLLSGPLQQIQANWKTAGPSGRARPHNHPEFRPEKTG